MGLTNQERINFNSKVLAAKVIDNNQVGQWYESKYPYSPNVSSQRVLLDYNRILQKPSSTLSSARYNVLTFLSDIVTDYTQVGFSVRLTSVPGTNGTTYVAKTTYNDLGSETLLDWLQPQSIPQANGDPSIGYSIMLYNGNPDSGGTQILTTDGATGSGPTASVGWVWNYDLGMLFLSDDYKASITNPYIKGFKYDGTYLSDINFTALTDTYITTGYTSGNDLILEDNNNNTININLSGITSQNTFSGLTDVNVSMVNNNDILIYNNGFLTNVTEYLVEFSATIDNQVIFTNVLPTIPFNPNLSNLTINGVDQVYGNLFDYILSGDTMVWVSNKHNIEVSDELIIKYY